MADTPNDSNPMPMVFEVEDEDEDDKLYDFNKGDSIQRYTVIDYLGRGTYGQVYHAVNQETSDKGAIKIAAAHGRLADGTPGFLNTYIDREIQFFKLLKDAYALDPDKSAPERFPHLIEELQLDNGRRGMVINMLGYSAYYIMTLNKHAFYLTTTREVSKQVANALDFLHRNKLFHGDIKLENVMFDTCEIHNVTRNGQTWIEPVDLHCRLIDFGSSIQFMEKDDKVIKHCNGTRYYHAPEITLGIGYGFPADLWSFGCLLFEMHAGYPLFQHDDDNEHLYLIEKICAPLGDRAKEMCQYADRLVVEDKGELYWKSDFRNVRTHYNGQFDVVAALVRHCNAMEIAMADIVFECLATHPTVRPTTEKLVQYPFFTNEFPEL